METATTVVKRPEVLTKTVQGRRVLHFEKLDDILDEADRLVLRGEPRALGNWSAGAVFMHLAQSCEYSIHGPTPRIAFWKRLLGRLAKKRVLRGPFPTGVKLPKAMADKIIFPDAQADESLKALHAAIKNLKRTPIRVEHPFIGKLTRDEWDQFHLRHAEHHLGFLIPAESPSEILRR